MSGLSDLAGLQDSPPADRRRRLVEAVSYSRAVKLLDESGHIGTDDLDALRSDADAELARSIRSCLAGAATPRPTKVAA